MKTFICTRCLKLCYSSTSVDHHLSEECPVCKGTVVEVPTGIKMGQIMLLLGYIDEYKLKTSLALQKKIQKRLGEILLESQLINQDQLNRVLLIQREVA